MPKGGVRVLRLRKQHNISLSSGFALKLPSEEPTLSEANGTEVRGSLSSPGDHGRNDAWRV
jgi:hypothetical protein